VNGVVVVDVYIVVVVVVVATLGTVNTAQVPCNNKDLTFDVSAIYICHLTLAMIVHVRSNSYSY